MKQKHIAAIGFLILLVSTSLACSLVTGIGEKFSSGKGTAEAAATSVKGGLNLAATAQAIITQVGGSHLLQTAEAVATQAGESGFLLTAQAIATQQGPGLLQTAQAVATEKGPALIATAQAVATEKGPALVETAQALATAQGPGMLETAQAVATQFASGMEELPEDIPMVQGEISNFFSMAGLVSYFTTIPYADVLTFYKNEMPANDWEKSDDGWVETANTAVLIYNKADQKATVTLSVNPVDNQTIVLIILTSP